MRILVVSNFYPPYAIGGMEYRCREVVDRLRQRGHQVIVLTSVYVTKQQTPTEDSVYRLLSLESDLLAYRPLLFFTVRRQQERQNLAHLGRLVESFAPDVVFVWGMWNLSPALPYYAEHLRPGHVVYSLAHDWPAQPDMHTTYWQQPARRRFMRPVKKLVGRLALATLRRERGNLTLQFEYAICVSRALRDGLWRAGVPLKDTRVIYPGIELKPFLNCAKTRQDRKQGQILSLLYAGTLAPHKGVHTTIEAMAYVMQSESLHNVTLTIAGSGHPSYRDSLRKAVSEKGLDNYVQFLDWVPREQMPALLSRFDVLLFPSIWEEPFARIILEAMAAGLVVVGTPTGGTKEVLIDGVSGLTFAPEDATGLARQVRRLITDPSLCQKLSANGRITVAEKFDLTHMVDEIEAYLVRVNAAALSV